MPGCCRRASVCDSNSNRRSIRGDIVPGRMTFEGDDAPRAVLFGQIDHAHAAFARTSRMA